MHMNCTIRKRTSLAVQKANYAVKMYKNVGFYVFDENDEEYIMVCDLNAEIIPYDVFMVLNL